MKNKRLFVSIVALLCMAALLCACSIQLPFGKKPAQGELVEKHTYTVQVVHSDGTMLEKEITTRQKYLAHALFDEGILVEEEALTTGMYLIVDGEEASWEKDQAYWGFFVNGEYAIEGMNTTQTVAGAVYRLEYTVG